MSPFDLPGPLFLVFYFCCGAVALTGLAALQAWAEPRGSVKVNFSDPYLIAFLRGGKNQTLRTATVSLIDRALIKVSGSKISAVGINASNGVRVALEYELLRYCKTPVEAASVYSVHAFDHFMQDYERELVRLGLMPDESAKGARWKRLGVVQALLSGIAITKIALAIERGHKNIGFLIVLALTVAAVAYRIGNPRLTGKGKALLDDLRLLLSSLRARATGFQPGANSNELALLAAAFGVDALPTSVFPHAKTLFPKAAGSSSGSCGSLRLLVRIFVRRRGLWWRMRRVWELDLYPTSQETCLPMRDRIGLGWRPELAAGILSNLNGIDVVEVIADDYFDAPARQIQALRTLATQVPIMLHGLSLGMASTAPVERKRLEKMARLVDRVQPEFWSEHLAFVRADNIEIGHLAAPPRTASTIDSTSANLAAARGVVGSAPLMENIATLIDPPASDRDEPEWLCETLETSDSSLLLDLHNLYVNSINFGLDPMLFLQRLPVGRIHAVHIAGGRLAGKRILDDHLHDPPDPVFGLLAELAARCPNPLSIILERDGAYPPMQHILWQLGRARAAVQCGRARSAVLCNILLEADCPQQTVSA